MLTNHLFSHQVLNSDSFDALWLGYKFAHDLEYRALRRYSIDDAYLKWDSMTPEPNSNEDATDSSSILIPSIEASPGSLVVLQHRTPSVPEELGQAIVSDPDDENYGKKNRGSSKNAPAKSKKSTIAKHTVPDGAVAKPKVKAPLSEKRKAALEALHAKMRGRKKTTSKNAAAVARGSLDVSVEADGAANMYVKTESPAKEEEGTPCPTEGKAGGSQMTAQGVKGLNMSREDAGVSGEGNPAGRIGLTGLVTPGSK